MVNELFIKLLEQNNRLVVPELGAFLRREQDGNETIVFTPFLKKDDGVLLNSIVENYDVSSEDASEMIREFVTEVQSRLNSNGKYHIENMGTIEKDANGALSFSHNPKTKETPEPSAEYSAPETPASGVFAAQSPMQSMMTPEPDCRPRQSIEPHPDSALYHKPASKPLQVMSEPDCRPRQTIQPHPVSANTSPSPQPIRPRPITQQSPLARPVNAQSSIPQPVVKQQARRPMDANRRHVTKKKQIKGNDIWLIVAIAAALVAILLLIYGWLNPADPEITLDPDVAINAINSISNLLSA